MCVLRILVIEQPTHAIQGERLASHGRDLWAVGGGRRRPPPQHPALVWRTIVKNTKT